ncbi:hypothetical protein, partial [Rhodococcus rhodnii]
MGIEIPGYLRPVAEFCASQEWPEADETAMERAAAAWRANANALSEMLDDARAQIKAARTGLGGAVDTAVEERWARLEDALESAAQLSFELAVDTDGSAEGVRNAKLRIIQALIILAAQLAGLAAWMFLSAGLASPAAIAAQAATRAVVQMIMRWLQAELLKRVVAGAVEGASSGILDAVAREGALQVLEMNNGKRSDVDFGNLFEAAGQGAFKGALEGGAGSLVPGSSNKLRDSVQDRLFGEVFNVVQEHTVGKPRAESELAEEIDEAAGVNHAGTAALTDR